MAWLYVPAVGGLNSGSSLPSETPTAPSVTSSGKPMRPASWSRAWKKGGWIRLLSGTTLAPSTADAGVDAWISSLPGSPAPRGAQPDLAKAQPTSGGSGRTSPEWFARWDRDSSSWKTSRRSLLGEDFNLSSLIWPSSGSMRNGVCYERALLVQHKCGTGCSSWPAPTAGLFQDGESVEHWDRRRVRVKETSEAGNGMGRQLTIEAQRFLQYMETEIPGWLFSVDDRSSRRHWSGPRASTNTISTRALTERTDGGGGTAVEGLEQQAIGKVLLKNTSKRLNPLFVEWLMGWPEGHSSARGRSAEKRWSSARIDSDSSGTV